VLIKVPVGGNRKSVAAVRDTVAYISRTAPRFIDEGRTPFDLYDELGIIVCPREIENWGLTPDSENLSRKARQALVDGGPSASQAMPERERHARIQAWHLIWSVDDDSTADEELPRGARKELLREAVRAAVYEGFAQAGRRVVWTVHDDGPHLHAHLVVQARGGDGRQLHFDIHGDALDEMRQLFVKHARLAGLNVSWERREDRQEVREAILNGTEPLRKNVKVVEAKLGSRDLAVIAPRWFEWQGLGYERRRSVQQNRWEQLKTDLPGIGKAAHAARVQAFREGLPLPPAELRAMPPDLPPAMKDLWTVIERRFVDPASAMRSWWRMAGEPRTTSAKTSRESPKLPFQALASWYLMKQPAAFGDVTQYEGGKHLPGLLKELRVPAPVMQPPRFDREALRLAQQKSAEARRQAARRRDRNRIVGSLVRLADRLDDTMIGGLRSARIRLVASAIAAPQATAHIPISNDIGLAKMVTDAVSLPGKLVTRMRRRFDKSRAE
jgi:hypothetical protein